jgi:pimeloyl-ACP methyl ester carboxylesterase
MRRVFALVALSLVACGGSPATNPPVVSAPDAGPGDGGTPGPLDGGGPDGGATDAGLGDAGAPDAGAADAGTTAPAGCVTAVDAGHHVFPCEGIDYDVEVSPACAGGGCGVILDVHGYSMTAELEDKSTNLRALAGPAGYVVVQPNAPLVGLAPGWLPNVDDPKVWRFLGDVRRALRVDPRRVHVTGFSQGGAMTWRLLCAHGDELASVAPAAAADGQTPSVGLLFYALDCDFSATERPAREVPVLQAHGTLDSLVAFAKGRQQRDAVLAAWDLGSPTVVASGSDFTRTRYTNARGLEFEFVSHDAVVGTQLAPVVLGGHCLPGGADLLANGAPGQTMFFSCAPPHPFTWGRLVLDFFIAHPKP